MLTNSEIQHILEQQPYLRMRRFAELLGWRGLQMFKLQDERIPGGLLVYFMTSGQKFNIQINAREQLSTSLFQACVVAERYRIVHTDWHPFELFADDNQLLTEAQRLRPFLARQNFKDRTWQKAFAEQYPERIYPLHRRGKGK